MLKFSPLTLNFPFTVGIVKGDFSFPYGIYGLLGNLDYISYAETLLLL